MRVFGAVLVSVLFLGVSCVAQDASSPATDTNSKPSVAAAARANRERKTEPANKIDPAKETDIRRLLVVMGAQTAATQMMGEMERNIKPLLVSSLPAGEYRDRLIDLFFQKFQSKLKPDVMADLAIPVYDKYLSDADIRGMIDFYSTPLGKKVVQVLPQLMSETGERGRQWGEKLGRDSMTEVLSENPDLQKAMQEASRGALPR